MLKSVFCATLALGAATLVGCKDDENKTAPAAATAAPPTTMPAAPEVPTPPAASAPAAEVTPPALPTAPAVPAVPAAPAVAVPTTAPAAATVSPDPQSMLTQVEDDIKNKNWDDASATLKKLVAMKDQLPQSVQDQIANLQKTVDAGKLGSGLGIPGLGK
jgi:hypothetical protein